MSAVGKVIAAVLLAPVVVVVAGIGGCEARKTYYDWQVRKMCEKDGGVVIYERVALSRADYEKLGGLKGEVPILEERSADPGYPYVSQTTRTNVRESNPWIWRSESVYKRRSDGRTLARLITYSRVGGDFPTFAHPSSFSCPEHTTLVSQARSVFVIEGERK